MRKDWKIFAVEFLTSDEELTAKKKQKQENKFRSMK